MKLIYSSLLVPIVSLSYIHAKASLIPPNAKAGECYAKVVMPAKYKSTKNRILVQEASDRISIVPAKYEWISKRVEVTPKSKKLVAIPASYKKIIENVEVKAPTRTWRTTLKRNSAPVSKELLVAAKIKGVDIVNTVPGTCYREYYTPEKYKTVIKKIIIEEVKEKNKIIPAKYVTVEESIEIVPASKKTLNIPAVYELKEEKILVEKAKTVWKKGVNPAQKLNGATGEIMCLVKIPAKYKIVKKRVVKTPANIKVVEIPAKTTMIKRKKLISEASSTVITIPAITESIEKKILEYPSRFSWIKVGKNTNKAWHYTGHQVCLVETPAQHRKITRVIQKSAPEIKEILIEPTYKTIKVKKLVEEARKIKTPIEAIYKIVERQERISDSYQSWERILCQTNMNKEVILKIQKALQAKEYKPGKPDGVLGKGTRVAIDKFQRDNSLATGGITYETLKALRIEL
jgi:hypothetical protein